MRKRPPSRFGVALVKAYRKRGLTQYRLAQLMGRSTRYLNQLEHDRSEPRFTTILLLADAIGVDPGELINAAAKLSWAALAEKEAALAEKKAAAAAEKKAAEKEAVVAAEKKAALAEAKAVLQKAEREKRAEDRQKGMETEKSNRLIR